MTTFVSAVEVVIAENSIRNNINIRIHPTFVNDCTPFPDLLTSHQSDKTPHHIVRQTICAFGIKQVLDKFHG